MKEYKSPIRIDNSNEKVRVTNLGQFVSNLDDLRNNGTGIYITEKMLSKFNDYLLPVNVGGKVGFINNHCEFVVAPEYDDYNGDFDDSDSFVAVRKDLNWGIVNSKGDVVYPCKFRSVCIFQKHYAIIRERDCDYLMIDIITGKEIIEKGKYYRIFKSGNNLEVATSSPYKVGIIDINEKIIIPIEYDWICYEEDECVYRTIKGKYNDSVKQYTKFNEDGTLYSPTETKRNCKPNRKILFSVSLDALTPNDTDGR